MQMPADRVEPALRQRIASDNPVNRHGQSLNKTERLETFDVIFYVESPRVKFLITFKKKLLNSVKRNKLKRQIKEFIRLNQYNLKKIDCAILIAKFPASRIQLLKELEFLLTL